MPGGAPIPAVSVVIPTLDAAPLLPGTLASLGLIGPGGIEVIVADGRSLDATRDVARAHGAQVVEAPRGRGRQLAAGARAASGEWLLFLHADTALEAGWREALPLADPGLAFHFTFALDDPSPAARRLERRVAWRCRWLGLPYGDQGLLISRALHDRLGGFTPVRLMEDVDFVARIGRARLRTLPARAVTSAARWRQGGWRRRSARNLAILALWLAGVPAAALARLYR